MSSVAGLLRGPFCQILKFALIKKKEAEEEEEKRKTHAGNVVVIADGFLEETIADFPGEDGRAFAFELRDLADDIVGCHPRFGAANGSRPDRARLVIPDVLKLRRRIVWWRVQLKNCHFD